MAGQSILRGLISVLPRLLLTSRKRKRERERDSLQGNLVYGGLDAEVSRADVTMLCPLLKWPQFVTYHLASSSSFSLQGHDRDRLRG